MSDKLDWKEVLRQHLEEASTNRHIKRYFKHRAPPLEAIDWENVGVPTEEDIGHLIRDIFPLIDFHSTWIPPGTTIH